MNQRDPDRSDPRAPRVMVVDDNPINQLVARQMLLALGVQVDTAEHGAEALARLELGGYALVFMDVMMPVLDGLAATRAWRQREQAEGGRRLPIVALTANAMTSDRERCLAAGMDDYLSKPVRREQLAQMLVRWLPREPPDPPASNGGDALP
jgi:CheY-like chemotaxis protein